MAGEPLPKWLLETGLPWPREHDQWRFVPRLLGSSSQAPKCPTEPCFMDAVSLLSEWAKAPRFKLHSISFFNLHTEVRNSYLHCYATCLDIMNLFKDSFCSEFFPHSSQLLGSQLLQMVEFLLVLTNSGHRPNVTPETCNRKINM